MFEKKNKNKQSISKEEWKQVTEFADMLAKVAKLLDESADIEDLKKFVMFFAIQCILNSSI